LVAQHQDLDVLGAIASAAQHQQVDDQADKYIEAPHALILAASAGDSRADAKSQVTAPAE
jgi:hypothetical protein